MPDPILVPSLLALSGGGFVAARDYLKRRFEGPEDRYMALYGREAWGSSNMDLSLRFAPEFHDRVVDVFLRRLDEKIRSGHPTAELYAEEVNEASKQLAFVNRPSITVEELMNPRLGVYFDVTKPGAIRLVWNHMQVDGVGLWRAVRPLFDPNPPLVSYDNARRPPPFVPELLALPRMARRLSWRGKLGKRAGSELVRGLQEWTTEPIRALKDRLNRPFNLVTSALAIAEVFRQHPDLKKLTAGLTVYFPFLKGRNRYGVFTARVRRDEIRGIVRQMEKQLKSPMVNWGVASAQAYALGRTPDRVFERLAGYYRKQIDVLISNLPVGKIPPTLDGVPTTVALHPWELTLPYYFLLAGNRQFIHVSYTTRYAVEPDFCAQHNLDMGERLLTTEALGDA